MRRRFIVEMEANPTQAYDYQARMLKGYLETLELNDGNCFSGPVRVLLKPQKAGHKGMGREAPAQVKYRANQRKGSTS